MAEWFDTEEDLDINHYFNTKKVKMFSEMELFPVIRKSGLKIDNIFGNFNGSKFDLNSSPGIIIISPK